MRSNNKMRPFCDFAAEKFCVDVFTISAKIKMRLFCDFAEEKFCVVVFTIFEKQNATILRL